MSIHFEQLHNNLQAHTLSFVLAFSDWSIIGAVSKKILRILATSPVAWADTVINFAWKRLPLTFTPFQHCRLVLLDTTQYLCRSSLPSPQYLLWKLRNPPRSTMCTDQHSWVKLVGGLPFGGHFFISENKVLHGVTYEMNLNWTGFCSCFDIGVANCQDEELVKMAFDGHSDLISLSAHCTLLPHHCERRSLGWTVNGAGYAPCYFNVKQRGVTVLRGTVSDEHTVRIGITWRAGKLSLWVHGTLLKTLTYTLALDEDFYLFIRFYVLPWQQSRVRLDPIPATIGVS